MFWTYLQNMKMRYVERCFLLVNLAALPKDGAGLALEREGQGGIPGPPSPTYLPLLFLPPSSSLSLGFGGGEAKGCPPPAMAAGRAPRPDKLPCQHWMYINRTCLIYK
jgi:hypothetical protein